MHRNFKQPLVLLYLLALIASPVLACSRVLWNSTGHAIVVGRNMDWINDMPVDFYVLPRGVEQSGHAGPKSISWKSKHGQLALVRNGAGVVDGVNEKGFSGHLLWLGVSDYGARNPERPGLSVGMFLQYCLGNYASVREVAEAFEKDPFQIATTNFDGLKASAHLAFEDSSGDSAIIEYQNGKPRVYHGRQNTVMTNDPPYNIQLENLKKYKGFGGTSPLPGSNMAADRFVRGAYYLQGLPKPANSQEAVAYIISVMRNVSQPFGEVNPEALKRGDPHNSPTRWRTAINLTDGLYYYESTLSPNIIWIDYRKLNFGMEGLRKLDLQTGKLIGDCTSQFKASGQFAVLKAE